MKRRSLLVSCLIILFVLGISARVNGGLAHNSAASAVSPQARLTSLESFASPGASYIPDCNDPDANDFACTEPTQALIQQAYAEGYPYYIGHDEPSILFFSNTSSSGSNMQWRLNLPASEPSPKQDGSKVSNFELYLVFWIGLELCDPNSFPYGPCNFATDSNNPSTAGAAFMEFQFFPPGNCSTSQWCALLHINTWEDNNLYRHTHCREPTTKEFVTTNGIPTERGGPKLLMNNGDDIVITIHETPSGVETDINDLSTSSTGSMVASAANGFVHNANLTDCQTTMFDFHVMYATASPGQVVPWAALSPNVSFDVEIGHKELCGDSACSILPDGRDEGESPPGPGSPCGTVRGIGICDSESQTSNSSNAGYSDHDSLSYQPDWPDGSSSHPASIILGSPDNKGVGPLTFDGSGYTEGYSTIKFATTQSTSAGPFYPFYTQAGTGTSCRFNFGNDIPGTTTNDFGKTSQYTTTIDNPCLSGKFDFSMKATPLDGKTTTVLAGESSFYSISTNLISGTATSINLSVPSGLPSGATATFMPSSTITPTIDGTTSTLKVATSPSGSLGDFTLTIQGQGGGASHTATVDLHVYDFTVTLSPSDRTVLRGSATTHTVTLTLVAGSTTTGLPLIFLSPSGLPSDATSNFGSSFLTPTFAGISTMLTVETSMSPTGSLGDFTFTVNGLDPFGVFRSGSAGLHIYDFTVTSPSILLILETGKNSWPIMLTLTPGSSIIGLPTILLSDTGLPAGATAFFTPGSGSLSFISTFNVTTVNTRAGNYTLTITGTDNRSPEGGTRSISPTLTVLTPQQALQLLINQINAMRSSGVLTPAQAASLTSQLSSAIARLNAGGVKPACNQVKSFVDAVDALVHSGALTQAQADQLLDPPLGVFAIMASIPC